MPIRPPPPPPHNIGSNILIYLQYEIHRFNEYSYLNASFLLSEQQYGFRSQHLTELACVKLVDYITTEMNNIKNIVTNCYILGPLKRF